MIKELEALQAEALQALAASHDPEAVEAWRRTHLGRKGKLTEMLRGLANLPAGERPQAGQAANQVKQTLEEALALTRAEVGSQALQRELQSEALDATLPGYRPALGRIHPAIQALREIVDIFGQLGFIVEEWPEVETDENNFQLLNMPPQHPARDMWSTFYLTNGLLLRTHTSPGQIHTMRRHAPEPIRVILPGICYRYEQISARSEMQFYQVEGIAISHQITMADLKGTLAVFAERMFGQGTRTRFRASYFPFTEPSAEMDIECLLCHGEGCRVCKHSGWLEILGCGMIHPVVLTNGGYDPEVHSGYAFGMGPQRMAMLKYGINDIRHFQANDLRFLEQFS